MGGEHVSNIQKTLRWGGKSSLNQPIFALHRKTIDGFLDTQLILISHRGYPLHFPSFFQLPNREDILQKRPFGRFTHYLTDPALWHPNRRNFALGLAIGTFIGSLPFFGQVLTVLLISLWLRAYIPIAVFMPFVVTSPLTIAPLFYASYRLGFLVLTQLNMPPTAVVHYNDIRLLVHGQIGMVAMGVRLWHAYLIIWLGSIFLGAGLALIAYWGSLLISHLWPHSE